MHPASIPARVPRWGPRNWRRCSSLKYSRYSRSSRLASRARRRSRCNNAVAPQTASMRVLALDTTTPIASVAIVEDDRVLADRISDPSRSHAERLPGDILLALESCDLVLSDVDAFAIASGPGSFTG